MNLAGAFAAPTLNRCENEVGLFLERFGATLFDCFERPLCGTGHAAIGARAGHDGNGFDYAEVSVVVRLGSVVRGGRQSVLLVFLIVVFIR